MEWGGFGCSFLHIANCVGAVTCLRHQANGAGAGEDDAQTHECDITCAYNLVAERLLACCCRATPQRRFQNPAVLDPLLLLSRSFPLTSRRTSNLRRLMVMAASGHLPAPEQRPSIEACSSGTAQKPPQSTATAFLPSPPPDPELPAAAAAFVHPVTAFLLPPGSTLPSRFAPRRCPGPAPERKQQPPSARQRCPRP